MGIRVFQNAEEGRAFITANRNMRASELSPGMAEGVRRIFGKDLTAEQAVQRILEDIRANGDAAVLDYTERIDGVADRPIEVSSSEIDAAVERVDRGVFEALKVSASRIRKFHEQQNVSSWINFDQEGAIGQLMQPIERVGVYAPGGAAPYPSSVLMSAIPASVAGVDEVVLCAPPERSGNVADVTLVAARIAGISRVFAIGGAQAIGAMAYGTESVPKVDKILGPGNIFVVLAKRLVFGDVGIESLPGPTETLLIADETASPELCAADLLAQAEHDPMASAILVTTSQTLAADVQREIETQVAALSRADVINASLDKTGAIVIVPNIDEAFDIANAYAPEHLCLLVAEPWQHIGKVRNAGGIFVGENSPEVIGDYVAGPSHVMPTGQTARFASPVNVLDFLKVISVVGINGATFDAIAPSAARIAHAETLTAHAAAVERRMTRRKR